MGLDMTWRMKNQDRKGKPLHTDPRWGELDIHLRDSCQDFQQMAGEESSLFPIIYKKKVSLLEEGRLISAL
jgi:hypothetical protein